MTWVFVLITANGMIQEPNLTEIQCLAKLRDAPMYLAEQGVSGPIKVQCKREEV